MHQRDPRPSYAYDQSTAYAGHVSHSEEYTPTTGYQQYHDGHYYVPPPTQTMGGVNEYANQPTQPTQPNPYVRSMTPSHVEAHRYPNPNRDTRYINSHDVVASSSNSSIAQATYVPPNQYYDAPYIPPEYRTQISNHSHPRIPTPSEIASSYNFHMTTPQSPTIPKDPYTSPVGYPAPPHIFPPHPPVIHRIVTGRPRTASAGASTSPTSASSPSGERFPCDKCGKTFSRSHDRKRHHETQHLVSPVIHSCKYCGKEFSRADSLKRHLDNGCDEMPTLSS